MTIHRYAGSSLSTEVRDSTGVIVGGATRASDFKVVEYRRVTSPGPRPKGWKPPKGYELLVDTKNYPAGSATTIGPGGYTTRRSGTFSQEINWDQNDRNRLSAAPFVNQALLIALGKLKDLKIDFGVALAESRATARLVGDAASAIGSAYSAFRKGRFKDAAKHLGIAQPRRYPERWLSYQYGVRPFISDIDGAHQRLISRVTARDWGITAKGRAGREQTEYLTYPDGLGLHWQSVRDEVVGAYVRLDYHPGESFMSILSQQGLTNPGLVAWELVPFSFVVDWILPVGNWLSTLDAALGLDFKGGSYSGYELMVERITGIASNPKLKEGMARGHRRRVHTWRGTYFKSPLPTPPSIRDPYTLTRLANGLSLLATAGQSWKNDGGNSYRPRHYR